eukprot:CAMPEP_0204503010 /NCGR_PEP_ID=MMETSP0471-20130131/102506_1 /ASSEMBLY_ACC=CAM_ASM_000602 /TAXON_ID=2969 /ORGANISM="Oxyrrhis marina" /LENGTH=82 /DNA_ID=CAMNT_0051507795 /DNA_START=551 /DNA_END=800 /DNA_ORIENTATION=+
MTSVVDCNNLHEEHKRLAEWRQTPSAWQDTGSAVLSDAAIANGARLLLLQAVHDTSCLPPRCAPAGGAETTTACRDQGIPPA